MTKRRPLAFGAALAIGFGSLFAASPAMAESTEAPNDQNIADSGAAPSEAKTAETTAPRADAPTTDATDDAKAAPQAPAAEKPATKPSDDAVAAPSKEEVKNLDQAGVELVAVGLNDEGKTVVVTTAAPETKEADQAIQSFAETRGAETPSDVVTVELPNAPKSFAAGDVVAGAGYITLDVTNNKMFACSIGFSAWGAGKKPAVLSAGHCGFGATDNPLKDTILSIPDQEPAVGGEGYGYEKDPVRFGSFNFVQFGGPGSTIGANNDQNSTDVSAIDVNTDGGWNLKPEVTTWKTAGPSLDSLGGDTVKIKSVGDATRTGVTKSGRTTGYTSGTVSNEDIINGWSRIEDKWVKGFSSDVKAAPGDSGGSVIQGTKAVGLISGGLTPDQNNGKQWTWSTSILDATRIAGYEVALDIDAPKVATGTTVAPGASIVVNAPTNATKVAESTSGASANVSGGNATFTAPTTEGTYTYSFTAQNGMSSSKATSFAFTVEKPDTTVGAPTIKNVDSELSDVTITGTGTPGATITLGGDATGTATVDAKGNWSVKAGFEIGSHSVTATQTIDGKTGPAATGKVVVRPVAPKITSIKDGQNFKDTNAPSTISGTGIEGARVDVAVEGKLAKAMAEAGKAPFADGAAGADGTWTVDFGEKFKPGTFTASATQTVNGVKSKPTAVKFTVEGGVAVNPNPNPNPGTNPGTDPAGNPGDGNTGGDDGNLAVTGGDALLPLGIAAGAALLLGGGVIAFAARRMRADRI
ncbi:hypothetical protein JD292_09370 [Leucobacter sp. CSA2]|uniref:Peptidase S1 domain-containing protein n=1 Tax=Leucobacter edaphi TaxID=2796472 RepID=A0A934QE83_9MICO|nr:hypothetical protein [Leucobacter edaphi]MBK0422281.1 hypothetical protein [Leucobacter edaphi]